MEIGNIRYEVLMCYRNLLDGKVKENKKVGGSSSLNNNFGVRGRSKKPSATFLYTATVLLQQFSPLQLFYCNNSLHCKLFYCNNPSHCNCSTATILATATLLQQISTTPCLLITLLHNCLCVFFMRKTPQTKLFGNSIENLAQVARQHKIQF